jgi:carbamate kinase
MLPKINAAIAYLSTVPTGKVIITSLNKTADVINGKVGTIITK